MSPIIIKEQRGCYGSMEVETNTTEINVRGIPLHDLQPGQEVSVEFIVNGVDGKVHRYQEVASRVHPDQTNPQGTLRISRRHLIDGKLTEQDYLSSEPIVSTSGLGTTQVITARIKG